MTTLRAFIAIELPKPLQEGIVKFTAPLRQALGDDLIRWIPTHNLHLTLKFLGNIPSPHVDFIIQLLDQVSDSHPPFILRLADSGSFPNIKQPRILWVGIHASPALFSLQKRLEAGAARLGYPPESRPFSPHLTIGRVRSSMDPANRGKIQSAFHRIQLGDIGAGSVESIHLYQSELKSDGSIYTKLHTTVLKKPEVKPEYP